ncbi:MAG TPA: S53 family peptidase [Candidatus Dormibacteraeota bacterium]|nr:S53 family peptidase [Candidatus Dormibacteraeota bacterium]
MFDNLVRLAARKLAMASMGATAIGATLAGAPPSVSAVVFHPTVSEAVFLTSSEVPPTQLQCQSRHRRCFNPTAEENSYNLGPLYSQGYLGQGQTIVIVDSFGSETIRHDLKVFNNAFGLPHLCGEEGTAAGCSGPKFSELQQGNTSTNPLPGKNSTGQEDRSAWALEVSLDVEWSHAMAPKANILLVTTPTAETLGVQGFPDFFKAEQDVIDQHLGSVISQSFGSAEEAFGSTASLENLRFAFKDALANHVTVFASSGDGGTANIIKTPVKSPTLIPYPTVGFPASDPLVTAVGGTNLCTDPNVGSLGPAATVPVNEPAACRNNPTQREVAWAGSGGGFSHVFSRPAFQNGTVSNAMRGVPDIALQASPSTGMLVYITNPGYSGLLCPPVSAGIPCSTGWYVVGGTSSSSPQWAGLIAVANQLNQAKHPGSPNLGYISPALYKIASDPVKYKKDFFDVTVGNNQTDPTVPGYSAGAGWDPVTGLGTPNAANLLPDLIKTISGS